MNVRSVTPQRLGRTQREERRAGDAGPRMIVQVEPEPRDLRVGRDQVEDRDHDHDRANTARGDRRASGSAVSSARFAAVSNPTKIRTPYSTPKKIPDHPPSATMGLNVFATSLRAADVDDHLDEERQDDRGRDQRQRQLHARRDLHAEVQDHEHRSANEHAPRPDRAVANVLITPGARRRQ